AYNMGNIGKVNHAQGYYELAKTNLSRAIALLKEVNDDYGISDYAIYLSNVFEKQNDLPAALKFAKTGLDLSEKLGLKDQISDANLQLSQIYDLLGDKDLALTYYKAHIQNRDSLQNIKTVQQMANLRTNYEVSQKQVEVDLLNQQKSNQRIVVIATTIALVLIGLLAFGLYRRYRFIRKTSLIIENERKRSESLLLNILPEETASELKKYGKVKAKKFNRVTVMFTDFVGFTRSSENLSPEELVESVDYFFSKFDEIIDKYGLEKIKTIGDAYMCTGGINVSNENHPINAINAAFEIADFMELSKSNKDIMPFDVRIGINTGPVVAGVVGTKKFAYDIWGDTVNVASRMESMSKPGRINISENTYQLIKETFNCKYRGEIDVKNKGMMKMYYVNGLKTKNAAATTNHKKVKV
ncbi:MAG: adenylate/guanylate cyclase domain-containing protein, partial [Flavobacteriaceae bacterium]|nr:adenylate/guanylate cyclase domain-containing protein [Flavobacteriaceae bacterium]